uniref:Uncharacterized protein n=1 Tax=uncultured bacterium RM35 TaxID=672207 RepID=D3W8L7_9BACT|nr:hypothetical protein [uncultured bacterium RM35]
MGLGESREAPYTLKAAIPAGTWHLVGDGELITQQVEVRFDIVWRTAAGVSTTLASVTHLFDPAPPGNPFNGVPFETDVTGIAAPASPGDKLILRFNTIGGAPGGSYTPNGDGMLAGARVPNLTLPKR